MIADECFKHLNSNDYICRNLDDEVIPQNSCWGTGSRICRHIDENECRNATTGECK